MKLTEYQKRCGVTYRKIARLCGCYPRLIDRIAREEVQPSFKLAMKIEDATNGFVSHENWYPRRRSPFIASVTIYGVSA